MHTLTVLGTNPKDPAEGRDYSYPAQWSECTIAQLGLVAALTSVGIDPDADDETRERAMAHVRLRLLHELTCMADAVFAKIEVTDLLSVMADADGAERVALLPSLDWCFAEPLFDESLVPEVVVRGTRYQGPTKRLGRFSLKQWGMCDLLMGQLAKSADPKDLHHLLGALYHQAGTEWNNEGIEARGAELAKLDDRTKLAAVMNYRGLRAWMARKYRAAHRGGKADPHGLQGMVVRLAGPKFGTVQETYSANVHDVLVHVEQSIEEAQRQNNTPKA
jgi:hypothetical protein